MSALSFPRMKSGTVMFLSLIFVLAFGSGFLRWLPIRPQLLPNSLRKFIPLPSRVHEVSVLAPTHLSPQVVALSASRCLLYGRGWYLLLHRASPDTPLAVLAAMGRRKIENSEIPGDFFCSPSYFRSPRSTDNRKSEEISTPSLQLRFFLALTSNAHPTGASRPKLPKVVQRGDYCRVLSENLGVYFSADENILTVKHLHRITATLALPWPRQGGVGVGVGVEELWCWS